MIIDFHTHIFPDKLAPKVIPKLEASSGTFAYVDGTLRGLQAHMRQAGVQYSVTLPVASATTQVESCNTFAHQMMVENADSIIAFGAMHPDYSDYKTELKRVQSLGLKGIKLHPDYQQTMFDDLKYKRIVSYANELGLIVVTHAGLDIGLPDPIHATPTAIRHLVDDVKPDKLVLAHMGGFQCWEKVLDLLCGRGLYLDTSFSLGEINYQPDVPHSMSMMATTLFLRMLEGFGEDHLLFATDSPWGGQRQTIQALHNIPLSEKQLDAIFSKNASRILQL